MDFHKGDHFSGPNMPDESEDCLFLNIFSPYDSEDESKLYPIVVWLHGGSFLAGSADTGIDMETAARNLVFRGITLVTLNYRLGPYGFMSITRDKKIEGNFGIYDMKLALEWVQRNIRQFNGDPSKVTIMGESAGAAAASLLGLSPATNGLVHQVIALSGSSTAGWAIHRHGLNLWEMVGHTF
jgi:carboxylesterase type B